MRRRVVLVALIVGGLCVAATAQDAAPKRRPISETVAALAGPDSPQRSEAIAALSQKGPDAADEIVTAAAAHGDDSAVWTGLAEALRAWDGSSAADALSRSRATWPVPVRSRLDILVHDLRVAKPLGPFPDIGTSPAEVAATVASVLARYDGPPHYRYPNPDAAEIARLGRDAIPALVAELRRWQEDDESSRRFRRYAAADALGLVADDQDLPVIRRLLTAGCIDASRSLRSKQSPAALDALVAAVERDLLDDDVTESLDAQSGGARADLAVVGWVERNSKTHGLFAAAEYLARRRCYVAIPALARALDDARDATSRVLAAEALSQLGERAGIEALLALFEASGDPWDRQRAGKALNEVVGRSEFKVDESRPPAQASANYEAAATAFRAWWDANSEGLRFDRESGRWRSQGEEAAALPESPPEVAAKVREVLEKVRGRRSYSMFDPEVRELVALGRDAVPELLRRLSDSSGRSRDDFMTSRTITSALADLIDERDVPAIARLLADGCSSAAACLAKVHTDAARDALLGAFRKGVGGYEVAKALAPYAQDPTTLRAAVTWLREFGTSDHSAGEVAELVAENGGPDSLAALRDVMRSGTLASERGKVAAAAARLGAKEAIEALVLLAESDETGATEAAFALNGICGRQVFSSNRRGDVGRTGNIDEASAWFRKWWEESRDGLRFDAARRLWTTGGEAPAIDVGKSPPDVAARVAQICAKCDARNGYTFGSKDAEELAALGRPAIPALVERIRAGRPFDEDADHSCHAAAEALRALRTDADIELLASLLREGRLAVATSLIGCRDPRARAAVLAVVATGVDDMQLMSTLGSVPADAATWEAVRAWFRGPNGKRGVWMGQFVERHATPEAVPALREVLAMAGLDSVVAVRCAAALARIGDIQGVEALLRLVDGAPSTTGWSQDSRSMAADRLDRIIGRRIFVEGEDDLPGTSHADAAKAYRAWWSENSTSLRYDATRRVWTTGTPKQVRAADAAPPELRANAEAILADAGAAKFRMWSADGELENPDPNRLVALGRGILPLLVETVRAEWPWGQERFGDGAADVAEAALISLAEDEDAPLMLELVGEGRLGVARWCAKHPSKEARNVVLDVVGRGFLDVAVLRALRPYASERPTHEALARWAERYGAFAHDFEVRDADLLVEILGTPPDGTHAPVLEGILDRPIPPHTRWRIAAEMAKHGVADGVADLVSMFEEGKGLTTDDAARVALALGDVAGTKLVDLDEAASEGNGLRPDGSPPRVIRFRDGPGAVKDRAAAVARVRAWWDENGERLRFVAGKWTTAK